ncbi:MAG TPA: hypothetical protein VF219_04335 [Vicinamibacterales bacterium]
MAQVYDGVVNILTLIAAVLAIFGYQYHLDYVSLDGRVTMCTENRYEDDWLIANWSPRFQFGIENKRGELVEILWDEARISTSDDPVPGRVTHAGEPWGDHFERQHAINLLPFRTLCDEVVPVSTVHWDPQQLSWGRSEIFGSYGPTGTSALACGKTVDVLLPLRSAGVTRRYHFHFGVEPFEAPASAPPPEWVDPPEEVRRFPVIDGPPGECTVDNQRDERLAIQLNGGHGTVWARMALTEPHRRDYLAVSDLMYHLAIYYAPHGREPKLFWQTDHFGGGDHLFTMDENGDGIDELEPLLRGNRGDAFQVWWWNGHAMQSLMPDDVLWFGASSTTFHTGVNTIAVRHGGTRDAFDLYEIRGEKYVFSRTFDAGVRLDPDFFPDFDAEDLGLPRTMIIRNTSFDDWPAPDAEIALNGRVVATAQMLARKQEIRVPVTLDQHNTICLTEGDDEYPVFEIAVERGQARSPGR